MHGNMDDSGKNGKDAIVGVMSFLKLDVLVPERMSKKVEADADSTAFKKAAN